MKPLRADSFGLSAPVAALPMYDLPWLQAANDDLWAAVSARLRAAGIDTPHTLTRPADLGALWRAPGLVLAQSCGYPLITTLRGAVQVVATPRYRAQGCLGALHRSAIIVGADSKVGQLSELRGGRCAVNALDSNSGMNLLRAEVAEVAGGARFFSAVSITHSHLESLARVAAGGADVAAIDCVTLAHLRQGGSALGGVRVLGWTRATPGLPLVTNAAANPSTVRAMRSALQAVGTDPRQRDNLRMLLIDGFDLTTEADYEPIARLQRHAVARGYPLLQ